MTSTEPWVQPTVIAVENKLKGKFTALGINLFSAMDLGTKIGKKEDWHQRYIRIRPEFLKTLEIPITIDQIPVMVHSSSEYIFTNPCTYHCCEFKTMFGKNGDTLYWITKIHVGCKIDISSINSMPEGPEKNVYKCIYMNLEKINKDPMIQNFHKLSRLSEEDSKILAQEQVERMKNMDDVVNSQKDVVEVKVMDFPDLVLEGQKYDETTTVIIPRIQAEKLMEAKKQRNK